MRALVPLVIVAVVIVGVAVVWSVTVDERPHAQPIAGQSSGPDTHPSSADVPATTTSDSTSPTPEAAKSPGRRRAQPTPSQPAAAPALSAERVAEQMAALRSYAAALRSRGSYQAAQSGTRSFGGEFGLREPTDRRWLKEQLFALPDGSELLPAVSELLRRLEPGRVPTSGEVEPNSLRREFAFDALLGDDPHRRARALFFLSDTVFEPGERTAAVHAVLLAAARDDRTAEHALLARGGLRGAGVDVREFLQGQFYARAGVLRAAALRGVFRMREHPLWESTDPIPDLGRELLDAALIDPAPEPRIAALEIVDDLMNDANRARWEDSVADCLLHDDRSVRLAAINATKVMNPLSLPTARALAMIVESDTFDVVSKALWALSATGHGDKVPLRRLLAVRDPDGLVTCPAIICIRHHGAAGAEAASDLLDVLRRADVFNKKHALLTLHEVAPGHEPAFELIVAASRCEYWPTEKAAAAALAPFGERAVPHLVRLLPLPERGEAAAAALDVACPSPASCDAVWTALAKAEGAELPALHAWLTKRVPDDPRLRD